MTIHSPIYTATVTLNKASHFDYFTFLLKLEECEINRQLSAYNLYDVQLTKDNDLFILKLDDSLKDYWKLEENTLLRCCNIRNVEQWFYGQVDYFKGKDMAIKFFNDQKNT
jgi:hypothetical protein